MLGDWRHSLLSALDEPLCCHLPRHIAVALLILHGLRKLDHFIYSSLKTIFGSFDGVPMGYNSEHLLQFIQPGRRQILPRLFCCWSVAQAPKKR